MNMTKKSAATLLILAIASMSLFGCKPESNASQQNYQESAAVTVQTITVIPQSLKVTNELPGRVEPLRIAEVRARVDGIIIKRNFDEGSLVKEGQVLFEIDPKPLQYALLRAEAELTKNKASLDELEKRMNRYQSLLKTKAISQQDYDTVLSSYKNTQGAYKSALADVEIAKLNLDYATVTAPISGRIGRSLVTEGALVSNNQSTALAIIQQIDPIYVDFRQPINEVLVMREQFANSQGRYTQNEAQSIPLTINIDGLKEQLKGKLLFADITVERSTGQVLLRGLFDNTNDLLYPGMFVRVKIEQYVDNQAILIPQRAVQIRTDGKAEVLTVNHNNIVEGKIVQLGKMYGGDWYITSGLVKGDSVIIGGSAQPGSLVNATALPITETTTTTQQAALAKLN